MEDTHYHRSAPIWFMQLLLAIKTHEQLEAPVQNVYPVHLGLGVKFFQRLNKNLIFPLNGDRGGTVVKVLCYKSEGRWFDSRWCHWNFLLH